MRKLILLFIIMSSVMLTNSFAVSDDTTTIILTQSDLDNVDNHNKRKRTPPAKETCILDFYDNKIYTSVNEEIVSYELWNHESDFLIYSSSEDSDLIAYLGRINGSYLIRLITESSTYIGFVDI